MTLCQIGEMENHILALSLLDDNEQCALNLIYTFNYYYWADASAGGLLVPRGYNPIRHCMAYDIYFIIKIYSSYVM
jgi:hypothetical protein